MLHWINHHRLSFHRLIPVFTGLLLLSWPSSGNVRIHSQEITGTYRQIGVKGSLAPRRARGSSGLTLIRSLWMWIQFDGSVEGYQFSEEVDWMIPLHLTFSLGVDGISRFFILLNSLLTPICVLASIGGIQREQGIYYGLFLILEGIVHLVFLITDLLGFYIAFEAVLIPIYLIIGRYGSRTRKIRAGYYFFLYTFFGSVWMLLSLLRLYFEVGTMDIGILTLEVPERPRGIQYWLWIGFFIGFAVKIPMLPVHIWLPEAHVEAPTAGSVILAGILLKLGSYGMVRVLIEMLPQASLFFSPLVYVLSRRAILYTSRTAIRQTDMKRVIAYASVAHINMTLVGLFSGTIQGIEGGIFQMISHGLVSGALFLCVGVLYDRHHTRLIPYYGGRVQTMPRFVIRFRFFTRANIALPGTSSFVGEFRILIGIFQTNSFVCRMSATGIVLGGAYSLWLFNRVSYGSHKSRGESVGESLDLTWREFLTLIPLMRLTLYLGIYPEVRLDDLHGSVHQLPHRATGFVSS